MRYDYKCLQCSNDKEWVVFEVSHGIRESPKVKCPKCKSDDCERAILETTKHWVRGNGWLDVKGRQRAMNSRIMETNDPYGHMRESGEADDLTYRLRNDGKVKTRRGKIVKIYNNKKEKDQSVRNVVIIRI